MMRNVKAAARFLVIASRLALISGCRPLGRPGIMSYEDYNELEVVSPYILDLKGNGGQLLYFGIEHTACPEHPQLALLEQLWNEYQPTLALSEGGVWPLLATRDEAIQHYGEGGLLRYLAQRDSVPIHTLEGTRAVEMAELLRRFSPESIKVYYTLLQVNQQRRQKSDEPVDSCALKSLKSLNATRGLEGAPRTLEELKTSCQRYLPELDDWRNIPAAWFDPTQSLTLMNRIARRCSRIRDEQMVKLIAAEVKRSERVFAVVGFSHVVMQERALKKAVR